MTLFSPHGTLDIVVEDKPYSDRSTGPVEYRVLRPTS